jgi:hypothetical protein
LAQLGGGLEPEPLGLTLEVRFTSSIAAVVASIQQFNDFGVGTDDFLWPIKAGEIYQQTYWTDGTARWDLAIAAHDWQTTNTPLTFNFQAFVG